MKRNSRLSVHFGKTTSPLALLRPDLTAPIYLPEWNWHVTFMHGKHSSWSKVWRPIRLFYFFILIFHLFSSKIFIISCFFRHFTSIFSWLDIPPHLFYLVSIPIMFSLFYTYFSSFPLQIIYYFTFFRHFTSICFLAWYPSSSFGPSSIWSIFTPIALKAMHCSYLLYPDHWSVSDTPTPFQSPVQGFIASLTSWISLIWPTPVETELVPLLFHF